MPRAIQNIKGNSLNRKSSNGFLVWSSILTCPITIDKSGKSTFSAQIFEELLEVLEGIQEVNYDNYPLRESSPPSGEDNISMDY